MCTAIGSLPNGRRRPVYLGRVLGGHGARALGVISCVCVCVCVSSHPVVAPCPPTAISAVRVGRRHTSPPCSALPLSALCPSSRVPLPPSRLPLPPILFALAQRDPSSDAIFLGLLRPQPLDSRNVRAWVAPNGTILCTDPQFASLTGILSEQMVGRVGSRVLRVVIGWLSQAGAVGAWGRRTMLRGHGTVGYTPRYGTPDR